MLHAECCHHKPSTMSTEQRNLSESTASNSGEDDDIGASKLRKKEAAVAARSGRNSSASTHRHRPTSTRRAAAFRGDDSSAKATETKCSSTNQSNSLKRHEENGSGTNRKRRRINRNSKEEQQRLQRLVEEWDNKTDRGITFEAFCKKHGIPSSTLHPYCCPDKSKRRSIVNGDARPHHNALIPPAQLEKFVSDRLHLKQSQLIQELKSKFQLERKQAENQFYQNIRPILVSQKSALDDTTASLPSHPNAAASTNHERGRDPPSVIVCQVINYVEV